METQGKAAIPSDSSELSSQSELTEEGKSFDKLSGKGRADGLFQACMKAIREAHFRSNRVRAALIVTGLFTDKSIYRAVISIFYVLTKELETKLLALKDQDIICQKILALGYRFSGQYEKDLEFLFDSDDDWKVQVETLFKSNGPAVSYMEKIRSASTGSQLSGAAFVLWGALIIGGGAAAKSRVKACYGEGATHLFDRVSGPGREERKRAFIATWDSLPDSPKCTEQTFDEIVQFSQEYMQGNNDVLCSLNKNPWWLPYVVSVAVGILSTGVILGRRRFGK